MLVIGPGAGREEDSAVWQSYASSDTAMFYQSVNNCVRVSQLMFRSWPELQTQANDEELYF
jgi:hypothetical protein